MRLLDGFKANKAIDTLLESNDPKTPEAVLAYNKLKNIGRTAVPKLIDALLDAPGNAMVENLLIQLLDNKSLPEYLDALTEKDRNLVTSIAKILINGQVYDPNLLLKQLDDPEIPKKLLLQILAAKKDRLNSRKVIALLESPDKNKRTIAFHLITAIASPDTIPYLLPYADDPDIGTRLQTIRTLSNFNHDAVRNMLIKALSDPNKIIRQVALEGIIQQNFEISAALICPLLSDPDIKVQAKAIDALIQINDPNTVGYLIEVLNNESEYIRRAAVEVLNEMADPRSIKNLLNAMRDTDWWVRVRAADALGSIGGPRVVEAVIELLSDSDEFMRRTAIEILNSVKDERAYFYLVQALSDDDWWVRERAVDALGQMGDQRAINDLMAALKKFPESAHVIIKALINIGDKDIVQILLEQANDASGELRKEMLLAISEFAKKEDIEDSSSMENFKTRVMSNPLQNNSSIAAANQPTVQAAINQITKAAEEETSAGILDLTSSNANSEIAHVFDATKFTPGYVISNRYKMVQQIGKGAFGVVVLVEDMMVHEEIILKFLNAHMSSDENVIQRFIHELRYARKITHENIIRIYDFISFGRSYAISMEYFKSHSLAFEIKTNKNPSFKRILQLFQQICAGVGFAHSRNVVHRDLKPANILVDENDMVKIVDFGLAAAASSADSRITRTGILVGTPTYMAPEQVRARAIDYRTDIYSLGILMYEMFVGRPPYKGEDHLATLFQHVEGKAIPANKANPKVSDELSHIIMKTMSVKPEDRYQKAEELSDAISQLLAQETA